jgi:GNAT superfamily N-acetyltransferase
VIRRPKIDSVVAESAGEVVGYCALREANGAVIAVNGLVAPNVQGHGVGTAMLVELCTRANERGEHVHGEVLLDSHASYQIMARCLAQVIDNAWCLGRFQMMWPRDRVLPKQADSKDPLVATLPGR